MEAIKKCVNKCSKKYGEQMYFLARIIIGFMFFAHGAQKLFGWFSGSGVGLLGIPGIAGTIEFVVGIGIFLGLYTSIMSMAGSLLMIAAYFMAHAGNGWNPLLNGGEVALLYLAGFLIMTLKGNGIWNLESKLSKKRG